MIRTNLSTRPFYNERAVHLLAAILAVALLAVTAWQAVRVVRLSQQKTDLNASIRRNGAEADNQAGQAQQIRSGLDQKQLAALADAAKEANDLIAKRTFSWTELFNQLEATLPGDVMLLGVHPEIKDAITQLHLDVQGKAPEEVDAFWDRLEKTGAFHDAEWSNVTITDDGFHRMTMNVIYAARTAGARPASAPPEKPAAQPEGKQ